MQFSFPVSAKSIFLCFISSILVSPLVQADWVKQQRDMMGTLISVELYSDNEQQGQHCAQQVFDEFQRIENMMSPYIADSELSQINNDAYVEAVKVSPELFQLIKTSMKFSRLSDGAFDISFASIGHQYDYRKKIQPDEKAIKQSLPTVNYKNILLENNTVRFTHPGMRIDLGGIAKGYSVDQAIGILQQCGVSSAIVSAGGDSRIIGDKNGRPWIIGIQHPRKKNAYALRIPLSNTAISTSGDYERYFLTNNERIHHIINPRTGKSAKKSWSVSVIGPDATTTDALSTTLFILGAEKGIQLIEKMQNLDAIIIDANGKINYSSGLVSADQNQ
jgi:FAD:protein FMN transferase